MYIKNIPVKINRGKAIIDISSLLNKDFNMLAISVDAADKTCGLLLPPEVVCGKVNLPLVSWNSMGMDWYPGRAIYTKKVDVPENYIKKGIQLMLDLGQIDYFAEIWE